MVERRKYYTESLRAGILSGIPPGAIFSNQEVRCYLLNDSLQWALRWDHLLLSHANGLIFGEEGIYRR